MRALTATITLIVFGIVSLGSEWSIAATLTRDTSSGPALASHPAKSLKLACSWKDCQSQCQDSPNKARYDQCMRWCKNRDENC